METHLNILFPMPPSLGGGGGSRLLIHIGHYSQHKQHKSITPRVHSKHEGTNMKCKPSCAPGRTLSKTMLWRDPLANAGEPLRLTRRWDTRRDPLASYGILSGLLWNTQRDTRRDPLASRSGGILGGIHWPAALARYWAGSTGQQLWRDTRRDPLASCSGGIHWVGAWCRSIANADSNLKSNNPFLSGGEQNERGCVVCPLGR